MGFMAGKLVRRETYGVAVQFEDEEDAIELSNWLVDEAGMHGIIDRFYDFMTDKWVVTQCVRLIAGAEFKPEADSFKVIDESDLEIYSRS